jgi:ATP-dependent DNA helicase Rep
VLNPAQKEAVRYLDGPCLVIAGAGSGKTRVITQKIIHLIDSGVQPSSIAAITFTNKASQEMQERLTSLLKEGGRQTADGNKPLVSTFHSLGVQMLRAEGELIGLKRNYSIMDSDDTGSILAQLLATTDRKVARTAQFKISLWKNAGLDPDEAAAQAKNDDEHMLARTYRSYNATLNAYQAVDFDDLIRLPTQVLSENPEAQQRWREKLRYWLVDEYQDTNATQYALLKLLVGPRAAFTAVGDDDQSIYGWRGATLENLNKLGQDFPELRVIKLEQNYRSSGNILKAANQLISNNPKLHEKKLWSDLGIGDPVQLLACEDDEKEAENVVMRLQANKFTRRNQFSDFAILYRGNFQARVVEQILRKEKIPYVISGGTSFFERAEIKDLISYLRLIVNDDDDPAFIRAITTPKRGVGTATLTTLGAYASQRKVSMFEAMFEAGFDSRLAAKQITPLREFGEFINRIQYRAGVKSKSAEPAGQVLDDMIQAIEYREHLFATLDDKQAAVKWQNVLDFVEWLKKRADEDKQTLAQLAQTVTLLSQLDKKDANADAVRLSTIHAAKGLEYPHVFVIGCEEGTLPHSGGASATEDNDNATPSAASPVTKRIEEERRLMYVAVTRAQRSLTLSWCKTRKRGKDKFTQMPSRFLGEMSLQTDPNANLPLSIDAAKDRLAAMKAMFAKPANKVEG